MTESTNSGDENSAASSASSALLGSVLGTVKSQWEAGKASEGISKASELVSNVTSSIPQGTKDVLSEASVRFFNPAYIRSPKVFFGIGEERPFFIEKQASLLASRVKHNLAYFYLNYAILTAILFFLTLIVSPTSIIEVGLLALAWASVIKATSSGSVTLRGITVSQKQATIAMSVISVVVLMWILSNIFWWTMSTSLVLAGSHSLFRDSSMLRDEEDKVEMIGDLGEDASFLNQENEAV